MRQAISFILDSLSAQMNVPNTDFYKKNNHMKILNHNATTLSQHNTIKECFFFSKTHYSVHFNPFWDNHVFIFFAIYGKFVSIS